MTTREQIIAASKESRLEILHIKDANRKEWRVIDLALPELERFYAIAFEAGRNAEREECAKLVEDSDSDGPDPRELAEAIRARN